MVGLMVTAYLVYRHYKVGNTDQRNHICPDLAMKLIVKYYNLLVKECAFRKKLRLPACTGR